MTADPISDRPVHTPEVLGQARRAAAALYRPIERFLQVEAASGILLLIAAGGALIWANSPWAAGYQRLWHTPFRIGLAGWSFERSLHFWINDLLMAVFFLLAGLEIKRELVHGALANVRSAALPLAAALGGMLVPAVIYAIPNAAGPGAPGWGVPMATDIAFAVGVLTLLGKRVPPALRVLLLAFAIIDDLGAILVIAIFYSSGFAPTGLLVASGGLLLTLALFRIGIRPGPVVVVLFLTMWAGLYAAGIHPTIAGVMLGFAIPARARLGPGGFVAEARRSLSDFARRVDEGASDRDLLEPLGAIGVAQREAIAPAVRAEAVLHPWVAYGIMPLFALANAGVSLRGTDLGVPGATVVFAGVALGLLIGKPVGVLVASWIGVRLGICSLPAGVTWRSMAVVGVAAGIGFTMAIFIAELAFPASDLLAVAKLAVLGSTAVAGVLAYSLGRLLMGRGATAITEVSEDDLEETAARAGESRAAPGAR